MLKAASSSFRAAVFVGTGIGKRLTLENAMHLVYIPAKGNLLFAMGSSKPSNRFWVSDRSPFLSQVKRLRQVKIVQ